MLSCSSSSLPSPCASGDNKNPEEPGGTLVSRLAPLLLELEVGLAPHRGDHQEALFLQPPGHPPGAGLGDVEVVPDLRYEGAPLALYEPQHGLVVRPEVGSVPEYSV